jgi:mannose-6-phosphate isomerase-like protein (cupin superfamily)
MLPRGYAVDIVATTLANTDFRRVLYGAREQFNHAMQLVVMCITPEDGEIAREVHSETQLFCIVAGRGTAMLDAADGTTQQIPLVPGTLLMVPGGTPHVICGSPTGPLRLYTIYAPPHHPGGTRHARRVDADAAELVEAAAAGGRTAWTPYTQ